MARSASNSLELTLPQRIGRYEAFLQIGAGGMARVYLALQRGPFAAKKLVVIKQLRENVTDDSQSLAMFVDEAHIALRLSHPNVVHTYEVVADAPDYYLAMEFLDGQSLMSIVRRLGRTGIPPEEHIWILTQVLAGLHYAHEIRDYDGSVLGVVHRDVSPANVVVCYSGEVKIVDFGIAKATGSLAETQQGVMKGKLGYAAPEQCMGKAADARSDIYAVGVMLWEALARRRRSTGETWPAMLAARIQDTEPPIEQVWPQVPPALAAITRRALHPDPERRYATALAFQRDLEQYLAQSRRKTGPGAIAALLRPHFEAERAELHHIIEQHVGGFGSPSGVTSVVPGGTTASAGSSTSMKAASANILAVAASATELEENTANLPVDDALLLASKLDIPLNVSLPASKRDPSLPPPPPARRLWPWTLAGAIGTGVAALAFMMLRPQAGAEPSTAPPTAETAAPTNAAVNTGAAVAANATASASAAPATGEVRLRIAVSPEDAEVRLDGRLLKGNPFDGVIMKDGAEHELTVSADKHRSHKRKLRIEEDVDLEIDLSPLHGARPSRTARAIRATAAPAPRPAAPEAAAAAPPPAATPRTTPSLEPGMDLRTRSVERVKRGIDEKDPYAQ